ncbi:MAG TPA: adventurous gliding motility protein CglE [Myxococcaceae bacterium]|nr:adventurous gliding motility protein CglE [Myxococcaceae bacterium]
MNKLVLAVALLPAAAFAQTPQQGVPLQVRRGFFTETSIGVFFTLGGRHGYSNAQTYLQLGVGYDLSENVELAANFGLGSNAQNCFSEPCEGPLAFPDNFTVSFLDANAAYLFKLAERFYLAPKLALGYTFLDPPPVADASGPVSGGPNFGGGLGLEYATNMDHFSIGVDGLARWIVGPNIPTLAFFGRVKYTF